LKAWIPRRVQTVAGAFAWPCFSAVNDREIRTPGITRTGERPIGFFRDWYGCGRPEPTVRPRVDEWPYFVTWPLALWLARLRIHPNQVGLVSFLSGLIFIPALLLGSSSPTMSAKAVFCLLMRAGLDCVDGQLARISGKSSSLGALYDLAADFIFAWLLFPAIAVHLWLAGVLSLAGSFLLTLASGLAFLLTTTTASCLAKLSRGKEPQSSARQRFISLLEPDRSINARERRTLDRLNHFFRWSWVPVTRLVYYVILGKTDISRPRLVAHLLSPCEYGFQLFLLAAFGLLGVPLLYFLLYPLVGLLITFLIIRGFQF